jgi:hypothetical protein
MIYKQMMFGIDIYSGQFSGLFLCCGACNINNLINRASGGTKEQENPVLNVL